jgi:hypothetical protein
VSASVIVATMWDHVEVVGAVDAAAPPTQADLDAIADSLTAENCGVRPVVRVLEDATLPAHEDTGEATCEELHEDGWWRYVRRWAE